MGWAIYWHRSRSNLRFYEYHKNSLVRFCDELIFCRLPSRHAHLTKLFYSQICLSSLLEPWTMNPRKYYHFFFMLSSFTVSLWLFHPIAIILRHNMLIKTVYENYLSGNEYSNFYEFCFFPIEWCDRETGSAFWICKSIHCMWCCMWNLIYNCHHCIRILLISLDMLSGLICNVWVF